MRPSFLFLLHIICAHATPEPIPVIRTEYVEVDDMYTIPPMSNFKTTRPETTVTFVDVVSPTNIPTNEITTVTDSTSSPRVTFVQVVLPKGSVPKVTYAPIPSTSRGTSTLSGLTYYAVSVTYTPFSHCSQTWKHTTQLPVTIPSSVEQTITPTIIATSYETRLSYYWTPDKIQPYYLGILKPTDIPQSILVSASDIWEPYGMSYCYVPTAICSTLAPTSTRGLWVVPSCTTTFSWDKNVKYPGLVSGPGSSTDTNPDSRKDIPQVEVPEKEAQAAKSSAMRSRGLDWRWTLMVPILVLRCFV